MGSIIENHHSPVDRAVGREQQAAKNEGIADIEQRAAQRNQPALKRVAGQAADSINKGLTPWYMLFQLVPYISLSSTSVVQLWYMFSHHVP